MRLGVPRTPGPYGLEPAYRADLWGYMNGNRMTPPATLWAPQLNNVSSLFFNNLWAGSAGTRGMGWLCFLLFNTRLTGAEISQLYNDFMASGFAL